MFPTEGNSHSAALWCNGRGKKSPKASSAGEGGEPKVLSAAGQRTGNFPAWEGICERGRAGGGPGEAGQAGQTPRVEAERIFPSCFRIKSFFVNWLSGVRSEAARRGTHRPSETNSPPCFLHRLERGAGVRGTKSQRQRTISSSERKRTRRGGGGGGGGGITQRRSS